MTKTPVARLTKTSRLKSKWRRSAKAPAQRMIHQAGRAGEDAADELGRQHRPAVHGADAHRREDGGERDERHRVRQRQHERREEVAGEAPVLNAVRALDRPHEEQARAEHEQDHAADPLEPLVLGDQKLRDDGRAERRDRAVDGVGRRGAEPRDEAREPAFRDRALDADRRDRPDRRRQAEPHDQTLDEQAHRDLRRALRQSRQRGSFSFKP